MGKIKFHNFLDSSSSLGLFSKEMEICQMFTNAFIKLNLKISRSIMLNISRKLTHTQLSIILQVTQKMVALNCMIHIIFHTPLGTSNFSSELMKQMHFNNR